MTDEQTRLIVQAIDRLTAHVERVRNEIGWVAWTVLFVAIGTCSK